MTMDNHIECDRQLRKAEDKLQERIKKIPALEHRLEKSLERLDQCRERIKELATFITSNKSVEDLTELMEANKRNRQLEGEEPIPFSWWKDCPEVAQKVLVRIIERNKKLTIENKKLIEGQQAMLTSGSGGKVADG